MKHYLSVILLSLTAFFLSACSSTPDMPVPLPEPYDPILVMEYYPYPTWNKTEALADVKPLPAYSGWTDERMERDLDNITSLGCTTLLVTMTPQSVSQSLYLTRLKRFYDICQEHTPKVRILLCFTSPSKLVIPLSNMSSFLGKQGLLMHPSAFRKDARTVLVFDDMITFSGDSGYDDLTLLSLGKELPARPALLNLEKPLDELPPLDIVNGKAWIRGGNCGRNHDCKQAFWPIPRKNGNMLSRQLEQAAATRIPVLFISSWNNFSDGSFIEPNTFDKDKLLTVLLNRKKY